MQPSNLKFRARFLSAATASVLPWLLAWPLAAAVAQQGSVTSYHDPAALVRRAVQNEIKANRDTTSHFLFRGTKTTPAGSTTKIYVEAKDATAGLVIAYNGKPLTPEQQRNEEARVQRFIASPDELEKKRQQERENADRTMRIIRALPDAFLYEYAGTEPGSGGVGRTGDSLIKLSVKPNPRYDPPSRVEEILTGMQGYVLVDPVHERIASIDGTLWKDVAFGWGFLGHLDRGGRLVAHQQEVGNNMWEFSRLSLKFTGKILLFKNLNVESTEVFSGFKPVPAGLSFAQALDLLKREAATPEVAAGTSPSR